MKLIPEQLKIPPLYSTENHKDPIVYCKLFVDGWTWYITELSIDGDIAFGYVISPFCNGELGYFSLKEIESIRGSLGLPVERDLSFKPIPLEKVKNS